MENDAARHSRHAKRIWILAAFGAIVAGMVAGALVEDRHWAWAPVVVGFLLYVLAFRRGLSGIRDLDAVWREQRRSQTYPWHQPERRHDAKLVRGRFAAATHGKGSIGAPGTG